MFLFKTWIYMFCVLTNSMSRLTILPTLFDDINKCTVRLSNYAARLAANWALAADKDSVTRSVPGIRSGKFAGEFRQGISIFTIFLPVLVQACTSTETTLKVRKLPAKPATFIEIISVNIQPEKKN